MAQAMTVEIVDRQHRRKVPGELVERTARAAARLGGGGLDELSVVLLDDAAMAELNRRLSGRDETTDVMAFEAEKDPDAVRSEIYVNVDAAARQGPEYGHTFEQEVCFLIAHGVLHALGHDDTDEEARAAMYELQHRALREAGV